MHIYAHACTVSGENVYEYVAGQMRIVKDGLAGLRPSQIFGAPCTSKQKKTDILQ